MTSKESVLRFACGIFVIVILIIFLHFLPTFMYVYNTYFTEISYKHNTPKPITGVPRIPKLIHQAYFNNNNDGLLDKYRFAQESWSKRNPDFKYKLWSKAMVDNLVKKHYPELHELYLSYPSWLNRNEVGRYVIIHRFGGIYADLDIQCTCNISRMIWKAYSDKKDVVLHLGDLDLASNDFFAATKRHPFLSHVISGLKESNRWYLFPYLNIMLTTGATYFHGRYRSYKWKDQCMSLSDVNEYFAHLHASSWHAWDGKIIIWFYRRGYIIKLLLLFVILLILFKVYYQRKKGMT